MHHNNIQEKTTHFNMPKYQNGKIYSIRSHQTGDVYIGSTTQTLAQRLSVHKSKYKRYNNGKRRYVTSFQILAYDDAYIELVEHFPCASKEELHRREGEIIRETNCVNKNIPGRSHKQWYEDNKDVVVAKVKRYREANKEKVDARVKTWRENNREHVRESCKKWRETNKEQIKIKKKEYSEKNKEKIAARCKTWYENNRTRVLERQKQKRIQQQIQRTPKPKAPPPSSKLYCIYCDKSVRRGDISAHNKTTRHIKNFIWY